MGELGNRAITQLGTGGSDVAQRLVQMARNLGGDLPLRGMKTAAPMIGTYYKFKLGDKSAGLCTDAVPKALGYGRRDWGLDIGNSSVKIAHYILAG